MICIAPRSGTECCVEHWTEYRNESLSWYCLSTKW